MYDYQLEPSIKRDLKKIKDARLKDKVLEAIEAVRADPSRGVDKTGNLKGFAAYRFSQGGVSYRLGYFIIEEEDLVVFLLFGKREDFYERAKRLFEAYR